ncbi:HAD family hydrolase [candidate division KSB1 bacterium]
MIKAFIFDWGDTIMRDFPEKDGPACYWDKLIWVPGAASALSFISATKDCYVASNSGNSDTSLMIKALKRMGASMYFKDYFTSVDLGFEKPDIRFFKAILKRINCKPIDAVMIGNNYEKDIKGAKEIGMQTVYFNEWGQIGNFDQADIIITHMDQLKSALVSMSRT